MSKQPLVSCSRTIRNRHRGAVLIVALIMLLVLTTLGVSTITSTNINLQLLQSQQRQQEAQQAAQNSINYLLSDLDYYINNASYLDGNGDFTLSFPSNVSSGYGGDREQSAMSVASYASWLLVARGELRALPSRVLLGGRGQCHRQCLWCIIEYCRRI